MSVVTVTADNIEEIRNSGKIVLLDFYATWCAPCKMLSPVVDQIADEHPEYLIGKVDVEEEKDLAEEFGIMGVPTLVVLKDGAEVDKGTGAKPKGKILEILESYK
ncbi:MAG: thioredoxin [Lachnospiraceae bacterium]|nr:thioredoxin [Lachnospiraceae bacterium]MBR4412075.1 thioredoxin [Lachnospiraceae bacterium]MBR5067609.1 thioredoxin [Lachnospiraceae bacterium]MBR5916802.1 thioredoxin [Lachnospiraceae bacterium]